MKPRGQRADLFVDVTDPDLAYLLHFDRDGGYAQARFEVGAGTAARRGTPDALPPNPDFPVDLANAVPQRILIEGGAMRGLPEARYKGEMRGGRDLAAEGMVWAINGQVGRDATPLLTVARGDSVRFGMANDTAFAHGMHLHGMHFAEVLPGGGLGPLRDSILLEPGETREVAFAAHNPGDWLFHCHMLGHHAGGMGTFIRVTG